MGDKGEAVVSCLSRWDLLLKQEEMEEQIWGSGDYEYTDFIFVHVECLVFFI